MLFYNPRPKEPGQIKLHETISQWEVKSKIVGVKLKLNMGQAATLYRVSPATFKQLENIDDNRPFDASSAKDYFTFDGSSTALEYILSKQQETITASLVSEIFNPSQSLGSETFETLLPEEQFEFYENSKWIPFIDPLTVSKLDAFFKEISTDKIQAMYNAEELNENSIYPEIWHNDNSDDLAFNRKHLTDDFIQLKEMIKHANEDGDYVLFFVG